MPALGFRSEIDVKFLQYIQCYKMQDNFILVPSIHNSCNYVCMYGYFNLSFDFLFSKLSNARQLKHTEIVLLPVVYVVVG